MRAGRTVRYAIEHIKLLHGDGVDLIEGIDARHVDAVTLDDVDELIGRRVAIDTDTAGRCERAG